MLTGDRRIDCARGKGVATANKSHEYGPQPLALGRCADGSPQIKPALVKRSGRGVIVQILTGGYYLLCGRQKS